MAIGAALVLAAAGVGIGLAVSGSGSGTKASSAADRLPPDAALYAPRYIGGAEEQRAQLTAHGHARDAALIHALEQEPFASWLVTGSPVETHGSVLQTLRDSKSSVPVFVIYYLPGRDCGGYSAGGAASTRDYKTWVGAAASAIGNHPAIVILEPDGLGLIPSVCPGGEKPPFTDAERFRQLNWAVDRLEQQPRVAVYLDGTHSHWLNVQDAAQRLVQAGVQRAQGFFLNVSNYRSTPSLVAYGTWISKCIAYVTSGKGKYKDCASEYGSPLGKVDPDKPATWHLTDEWYARHVKEQPTTHFVIDTSRNGQGSWRPKRHYSDAQDWCNPPGRGLGLRPTLRPGVPLVDAYLWVKVPGESDGQCGRGTGLSDPEWSRITGVPGFVDPPAGAWFRQGALDLVHRAQPPLEPGT